MASKDPNSNEGTGGKLWTKAKSEPSVPIGLAATAAMLGYAAYGYRHRGGISTSMYLMKTRVKAQTMIVGAMAIGVTYGMLRDLYNKK